MDEWWGNWLEVTENRLWKGLFLVLSPWAPVLERDCFWELTVFLDDGHICLGLVSCGIQILWDVGVLYEKSKNAMGEWLGICVF